MVSKKMKFLNIFLAIVLFFSGLTGVSFAQDFDFQKDQEGKRIAPKTPPPTVTPRDKKDEKKDDKDKKGNQQNPPSNNGKGRGKP